jgi:hypothetical protein
MTWAASRSFEAGDLRAAMLAYRDILKSFPDDPVAKLKQVEIEDRLSRSPPEVGRLAHYGARAGRQGIADVCAAVKGAC